MSYFAYSDINLLACMIFVLYLCYMILDEIRNIRQLFPENVSIEIEVNMAMLSEINRAINEQVTVITNDVGFDSNGGTSITFTQVETELDKSEFTKPCILSIRVI